MNEVLDLTPLVRWDGLHLVLNLVMVERFLERQLGHFQWLEGLRLEGRGDIVRVFAELRWRKMRGTTALDLAEIRLRNRRLGFRFSRPRLPGGLALPRPVLELALNSLESQIVTVLRGHAIVIVNLRQWIPAEVSLSVRSVQATQSYLHVWLGPGVVCDLPGGETLRLSAD